MMDDTWYLTKNLQSSSHVISIEKAQETHIGETQETHIRWWLIVSNQCCVDRCYQTFMVCLALHSVNVL